LKEKDDEDEVGTNPDDMKNLAGRGLWGNEGFKFSWFIVFQV
jgi:hypothetical protein